MNWIFISAILGGLVVGFMAGASPSPTGGNVAAAVAALLLGVLGFRGNNITLQSNVVVDDIGILFVLFLLFLVISYVITNIFRKNGWLEWMGIQGSKRKRR